MDIREIKNQAIEEIDNGNRVAARQIVDWLFGMHLVLQSSESYEAYDEANEYVENEFRRAHEGLRFLQTEAGITHSFGGALYIDVDCGDIAASPAINGENARVACVTDVDQDYYYLIDIDGCKPTSEQLGGIAWTRFASICERHLTETLEAETAE